MTALRVLVWQWGRRGAGPRFAVELAATLNALPEVQSLLSLSSFSEQLAGRNPPECALPYETYSGVAGLIAKLLRLPFLVQALVHKLRGLKPDVAVCAMPAALDIVMAMALRRLRVPYAVIIHDADVHPGDGMPLQMQLQRRLARDAAMLVTLSDHVATRLEEQGLPKGQRLIRLFHPPFAMGPPRLPPRAQGGPLRLLFFGRLLPYKGLDLFAEALREIGSHIDILVRVVGMGPESEALIMLRALPRVSVENRWVPEAEMPQVLGWADAVVLSYTEASQSGVAAAAQAMRRWLVATRVGGLVEQLQDEPLARFCDPTPGSLADAIMSLLSDPPCDVAHTHVRSWHDMAAALTAELRTLD